MDAEKTKHLLRQWTAASDELRTANDGFQALPEPEQADPGRLEPLIRLRQAEADAWKAYIDAIVEGLGSLATA